MESDKTNKGSEEFFHIVRNETPDVPLDVGEDDRKALLKVLIQTNLDNVVESSYIPELGEPKKGKVRDVYFKDDKVIMVTSDRVSAFDYILSRCIPFKGAVLNGISAHAMQVAENVMPVAMIDMPDSNVIVQRKLKNIGVECVVRGYVWGSMANAYEDGERNFCGIALPEGLLRYQKLNEPLFTPTTKAEKGHDKDLTFAQLEDMLGKEPANRVRERSLILFNIFSEYAAKKRLLLLDTKYEFGVDEKGELYLIDEAITPDSSRFCEEAEWKNKFSEIIDAMYGKGMVLVEDLFEPGKYPNITELLKEHPELKIKEISKQFVRDVLIESGYQDGRQMPELTDEQVIETSLRYVQLYERFTGRGFDFSTAKNPRERIVNNLREKGYIAKA